MNSNLICPISNNRIDENIARFNAVQTVALITIYAISSSIIPLLVLFVDFVLRSSGQSAYSPFALVSKQAHKALKLKSKLVNAGPKLFACRIGTAFSFVVLVAHLVGLSELAIIVVSILGLFSFLEAAFGFCAACRIYPFVYKFSLKFAD